MWGGKTETAGTQQVDTWFQPVGGAWRQQRLILRARPGSCCVTGLWAQRASLSPGSWKRSCPLRLGEVAASSPRLWSSRTLAGRGRLSLTGQVGCPHFHPGSPQHVLWSGQWAKARHRRPQGATAKDPLRVPVPDGARGSLLTD